MTFALLLRYWKPIAAGAVVLALVVGFELWKRNLQNRGVAQERGRVADSTLAVIAPQLAHVETVYVRDTVRVTRTLARLDTLRDTLLQHLTDTVRVREFITRADSAAAACRDLMSDCQAFRALTATKIAALESKLQTVPVAQAKSCTISNVLVGLLGVGAGAGVGYLAHRP